MIHIDALQFSYPNSAFTLSVPLLSISAESTTAIIGPSGCGKTTLLRLIAGIQVPESGTITVAGNKVSSMSEAARRRFRIETIGFVFQEFALLEYLNVYDNILLPYLVNRTMKLDTAIRQHASRLCGQMGLNGRIKHKPGTLSQGEKQRVAICRALINKPSLILADEPTGNLDPSNKQRTVDLLVSSAREAGATLLVVTHDHSLLGGFDRVIDAAEFEEARAEL